MRESMGNAFVPGSVDLSAEEEALIERRARLLGPAYRLFYERPLQIVAGEGVWLYDAEGRRYLDAYNNVPSVGHGHPHVVMAIAAQAAVLNTHTRYLHPLILDYSERLLGYFPGELSQVMYTCTGSEANDLALRIAEEATGGRGVVVTRFAYHGVTSAVSACSPALGEGVRLGQHVRLVDPPRHGGAFGEAVAEAFAELAAAGVRPAALLVDTVFTSDGNYVDPVGLLGPAVHAARRAGALFIADEVQPGFGRTGTMWGFERHGVVPDLVTLGKPMGNGHPIAAVVARPAHLAAFAAGGRYFNTFGGNPVSIAAASAVLDVIEGEGLRENAAAVGARLREGFVDLMAKDGRIREVRGAGLALAVELEQGPLAGVVVNRLRERGVLLSVSGPRKNNLKIRPPLCFGIKHAELLLEAVVGVLG